MKRTYTDTLAVLIVGLVLFVGGIATWQAYRQWLALDEIGGHMGGAATAMHGTHPVWYVFGTIVAAAVISGIYLSVRDRIASSERSTGVSATDDSDRREDSQIPTEERQVLDLLPDDERRILQPVLDSPGLTQIELRDRSAFSKSKVSQTVSDLEKRGLLYREPQGRTYRVYPADDLRDRYDGSSEPN